jgi:hypothetical protein
MWVDFLFPWQYACQMMFMKGYDHWCGSGITYRPFLAVICMGALVDIAC